ncbi:MAG: hypothetical protein K940chlam3_00893 [Chlamydiae bacterium]|nr:hypothetical protein [Chlamydiota bacterium]
MEKETSKPTHFKGKEAVEHVVEAQAKGLISKAEVHGEEMPGHISAFADTARETAVILLLIWLLISTLVLQDSHFLVLSVMTVGWIVWKMGRSAWLGWSRLERLHRLVAEEKWEIDHHRDQEREELAALYEAKGFKGKLLEDVMDVLMADDDRLLRVMLEEELGLSLEKQEHPLKQSLGAGLGALAAYFVCMILTLLIPNFGMILGTFCVVGAAAALSAHYEKNRKIPAIVWNLGITVLAFGCTYFLWDFLTNFL